MKKEEWDKLIEERLQASPQPPKRSGGRPKGSRNEKTLHKLGLKELHSDTHPSGSLHGQPRRTDKRLVGVCEVCMNRCFVHTKQWWPDKVLCRTCESRISRVRKGLRVRFFCGKCLSYWGFETEAELLKHVSTCIGPILK